MIATIDPEIKKVRLEQFLALNEEDQEKALAFNRQQVADYCPDFIVTPSSGSWRWWHKTRLEWSGIEKYEIQAIEAVIYLEQSERKRARHEEQRLAALKLKRHEINIRARRWGKCNPHR